LRFVLVLSVALCALAAPAAPKAAAPQQEAKRIPIGHVHASAREARAQPKITRRSIAPSVVPHNVPQNAIVITLAWNAADTGGGDLDTVLWDPYGCVAAPKNNPQCINTTYDANEQVIGGSLNWITYTPYRGIPVDYTSPVRDSKSTTTPAGAEEIYIQDPPWWGEYHHLVYQAAAVGSGFSLVQSALVTIWGHNMTTGQAQIIYGPLAVSSTASSLQCEGRFWNTFSLSFGFMDDDVGVGIIVWVTPTTINTVTAAPSPAFPTTAFETRNRTNSGCSL